MSVSRRAGPPHFGHVHVDELRHLRQRRIAAPGERRHLRQLHRQLLVRHGDRRRPSRSRSSESACPSSAGAKCPSPSAGTAPRPCRCRASRRRRSSAVMTAGRFLSGVFAGIDQPPVVRSSPRSSSAGRRRRRRRGTTMRIGRSYLRGELEVALVVRRHGHDRAGAVLGEHEVRDPDRHCPGR